MTQLIRCSFEVKWWRVTTSISDMSGPFDEDTRIVFPADRFAVSGAGTGFPVSESFAQFDVFSGEDHARSGVLYADQIRAIEQMPKVTLLRA